MGDKVELWREFIENASLEVKNLWPVQTNW